MTEVGRTVAGRYLIEKPLSEGGMGEVWLARDRNVDRRVVLKVPKAELLANPRARVRFEREVDALRRFEHPHVVPILDTGEVDGVPFLVMPFLPGKSLADRLARAPAHRQPLAQVLAWLAPLAQALDHLNARGLVHRDVKPSNILFDAHGRPLLADFGIAVGLEQTDPDQRLTQTAMLPGTPAYMAPEQALKGTLTGAADQYALAATAYEALVGELPFRGATALEVLVQKRAGRWLLPPGSDLPPHVAQALRRALSGDPARRFRSCELFVHALAAPAPTTDGLPPPAPPERRWLRALLAPLALLLLGGGAIVYWQTRTAERGSAPDATPGTSQARDGDAASLPAVAVPPATGRSPAPAASAPAPGRPPAAPEPSRPPAPTPADGAEGRVEPLEGQARITLEEPAEGTFSRELGIRAYGRVEPVGAADAVYVNGRRVAVEDGVWQTTVPMAEAEDGPFEIAVGWTEQRAAVRRRIHVDRTPPEVDVALPDPVAAAGGGLRGLIRPARSGGGEVAYVPDSAQVPVRVAVRETHLASLTCNGRPVALDASGLATLPLELGARHLVALSFEAVDHAGAKATRALTVYRAPRLALAWPVGWTTLPGDDVASPFVRQLPMLAPEGFRWLLEQGGTEPSYVAVATLHRLLAFDPASAEPLTATVGHGDGSKAWVPLGRPAQLLPSGAGGDAQRPTPRPAEGTVLCPLRRGHVGFLRATNPPLTIEGWLRLYEPHAEGDLFWGLGPADAACWLEGGVLRARFPEGSSGAVRTLTPAEIGAWIHVALYVGIGKLELFVNGEAVGSALAGNQTPSRWRPGMGMCGAPGESRQELVEKGWRIDMGATGTGPIGWRGVRLSSGRRYAARFVPPAALGSDETTVGTWDFGSLVEGGWWAAGPRGPVVVPYGCLATCRAEASAPRADLCAYVNGGACLRYAVQAAPRNATLESWVKGIPDVGDAIVASTPHLDLCVESGVPVAHASVVGGAPWQAGLVTLRGERRLDRTAWTHLACTRDGTRVRLHVDGALAAEGRLEREVEIAPGAYPLCIGSSSASISPLGDPQLVGSVDDVRLSGVARYAAAFPPATHLTRDPQTLLLVDFAADASAFRAGTQAALNDVVRSWPVGACVLVPSGR